MAYIKRSAEKLITKTSSSFPAVLLTGPRQAQGEKSSGK